MYEMGPSSSLQPGMDLSFHLGCYECFLSVVGFLLLSCLIPYIIEMVLMGIVAPSQRPERAS